QPSDLLVFHNRALPAQALSAQALTEQWIATAIRRIAGADPALLGRALRHALGFGDSPSPVAPAQAKASRTVLLGASDPTLERLIRKAGMEPRIVPFTPFDRDAAAQVRHFETYNRTEASQRVADIVAALRAQPGAALVASGDTALAGLLAAAVAA